MTRQDKIDKASTEWDKAYAIFHKADFEYTEIVEKATDDPEPQADDVETIAEGDEEAGEANLRNSYARTKAMHSKNYASVGDADWDAAVLVDEIDRLRAALTRLSAPVDVQARAEAVVQEFSDTYVMLSADTEYELSRLIVEQFTRKE
jgi:hypothetical protein